MERLASRADVRPATPDDEPLDRRPASRARLARALEDLERERARCRLAAAPDAPLAGDRASLALADGLREDGHDRLVEAPDRRRRERLHGLERMDLRPVEDLIRVDVADARDELGVEEHGFDRPAPAAEPLREDLGREAGLERLGADRGLERRAHLIVHDVEPAETARVLEVEVERAEMDGEARPLRRRLRGGLDPELPRELQVEDERAPAAEVDEHELPAPSQPADRAVERPDRRPPLGGRVVERDAPDAGAADSLREVTNDVLDLGQLGHRLCL